MKQWFILHVYVGYENKVKEFILREIKMRNLEEAVEEIFIPVKTVQRIGKGKRIKVEKKIYPGYILLQMEPEEEVIKLISNVPGVMPFSGFGRKPYPVEEEEVSHILGLQKDKEKIEEVPFSKGDSVKIVDGPFVDFAGIIEEIYQERDRLKVMVTVFGRSTPVELSYFQVEPM
ncbi:transcription termination/antitermination factor NusG [candidate division WOR-3 bacterium]|nr:transcription termination/antitermination factor NusG [candidate division WOR-3 bacterium]